MITKVKRLGCLLLALVLFVAGYGAFHVEAAADKVKVEAESGSFTPADKKESGESDLGNSWVSGFQNIVASYTMADDFEAGNYKVSALYVSAVEKEGSLYVKAGDTTISASWAKTGEWDWSEANVLQIGTLALEAGDTFQVWAEGTSPYIQIDYFLLTPVDGESTDDGEVTEPVEGICYQAEDVYSGNISEEVAADLQPGESLDFDVSSNSAFTAGTYVLTIRSCGNRELFTVEVNGAVVGTLGRTGTDFGQIYMTDDVLTTPLELSDGDVLTITAQSGEYWGWVDYILLSATTENSGSVELEGEAVEIGDGCYIFQAEYFTKLLAGDNTAANLLAGDVLEIPMSACEGFVDGWYTITIVSCGSRETIYLRLNGDSIGSVTRLATDLTVEGMTEKKFGQKKQLTAQDVLTLSAPADGSQGWIDYVILTAVDAPGGSTTVDTTEPVTQPTETEPQPTTAGSSEPADVPVGMIVGIAVVIVAVVAVVIVVIKKKK